MKRYTSLCLIMNPSLTLRTTDQRNSTTASYWSSIARETRFQLATNFLKNILKIRRVNFDEDLPVGVARKWMKELYKIELMFNRRESDNFCTRWSGGVWWQTVLWDDVWAKNQLLTFQFLLIPPFQTSKDQLLTLNEDECDEYGTIHSSNRWERGGGSGG